MYKTMLHVQDSGDRRRQKQWMLCLLCMALAGCVSQEELALQRQYEAQLSEQCQSFGFTPGHRILPNACCNYIKLTNSVEPLLAQRSLGGAD